MPASGANETNRTLLLVLVLTLIPPYLVVPIIETIASRGSKPKTPTKPKIDSTKTTTANHSSHSDNKEPPDFAHDVGLNRDDFVKKPLARRFTGEGLGTPTPVNYQNKSSDQIIDSQASDFCLPNPNRLYPISQANKVKSSSNHSNFDENKVFRPITPSSK